MSAPIEPFPGGGAKHYTPSGKFNPAGWIIAVAIGCGLGAVGAFINAYAEVWSPIVYLNVLIVIGLGIFCGMAAGKLMVKLRVRNVAMAMLGGLIVGATALAFSWGFWLFAYLQRYAASDQLPTDWHPFYFFLHVEDARDWADHFYQHGAWSLNTRSSSSSSSSSKPDPVKGPFLAVVWGCEGLAILGFAAGAAARAVRKRAFCEGCCTWCNEQPDLALHMQPVSVEQLRQMLESRDWGEIRRFAMAPTVGAVSSIILTAAACDSCGALCLVTATLTTPNATARGRASVSRKVLIDKLVVTPNDLAAMREIRSSVMSGAPPGAGGPGALMAGGTMAGGPMPPPQQFVPQPPGYGGAVPGTTLPPQEPRGPMAPRDPANGPIEPPGGDGA